MCICLASDPDRMYNQLPYRNLNYKAQKFAMVLSSLDIHGLNDSQTSYVILAECPTACVAQLVESRTCDQKIPGLNPGQGIGLK